MQNAEIKDKILNNFCIGLRLNKHGLHYYFNATLIAIFKCRSNIIILHFDILIVINSLLYTQLSGVRFFSTAFEQVGYTVQTLIRSGCAACGFIFRLYAFVDLFAVYSNAFWRFYAKFYLTAVKLYNFNRYIIAYADRFADFAG